MSEFHVNVVRVGKIAKHPNADTLSCARVFDYNVIVRTGDYSEGDLAVYIPIDSIVPDTEEWRFLAPKDVELTSVPAKYRRVKAKRLRGIFSQGMLTKLPSAGLNEGDDVCFLMKIEKWESSEEQRLQTFGECEKKPDDWEFVKYTDIEPLRRFMSVLEDDESVVITEKLHGASARFCHDGTRLWVGSRQQIKKDVSGVVWWDVARDFFLEEKLAKFPMVIFFGEVFGKVQNLNYGIKRGATFRVFDTFDVKTMRYNDWLTTTTLCSDLGLPVVPVLYEGKWNDSLKSLAEGQSTLAAHVREGFVVKPIVERYNDFIGRVILKQVGEGYMLR